MKAAGIEEYYRGFDNYGSWEVTVKGGGRREEYLVNETHTDEEVEELVLGAWNE